MSSKPAKTIKVKKVQTNDKPSWLQTINLRLVAQVILAIIVGVIAFMFYKNSQSVIQNLTTATHEQLKEAFFGEKPHLFYCDRESNSKRGGNKEDAVTNIPNIFTDLNTYYGHQMSFSVIDCNAKLPSNKTIYERFKLKKEWKPVIFGTAPWLKPLQAGPQSLKDLTTMKKFVAEQLGPKPTLVKSQQQLLQQCQFAKNVVEDDSDITPTCIVLLQGDRYAKTHKALEERLVSNYPKTKFVSVEANKFRLSFENLEDVPSDSFGLKAYALRNGTHYLNMVNPITWDYLNTFVSTSVGSPLYAFTEADSNKSEIKLLNLAKINRDKVLKEKKQKKNTEAKKQKASRQPKIEQEIPVPPQPEVKETKKEPESEKVLTPEEEQALEAERIRKERLRKERLRREEMDRQQRENLFEHSDSEEPEDVVVNDEEDDELIEL